VSLHPITGKLLELCNGDAQAVRFIEDFWSFCVTWDDLIDRDKPFDNERINNAMLWALFGLNDDPFYQRYPAVLRASIMQCIASWMTANKFEHSGHATASSRPTSCAARRSTSSPPWCCSPRASRSSSPRSSTCIRSRPTTGWPTTSPSTGRSNHGMGIIAQAAARADYKGAAEATAVSNQQAQTTADWANRPTVNTPWGQESWSSQAVMDPATGKMVNKWTQTQTLNPEQQAALDAQQQVEMGRSQLAQAQMGRAGEALATPFDWQNLQGYGQVNQQNINADPYMTSGAGEGVTRGLDQNIFGDAGRQRYEQMAFDRMAPQHQQAQAGLEGQLANMGLTRGSQDWNREMQRLQDQQSRERYGRLLGRRRRADEPVPDGVGPGQFPEHRPAAGLPAGDGPEPAELRADGRREPAEFRQGLQTAGYQNQLRQQQIAEQQLRRQMP
jgi:hypothetical protein